MREMAFEIFGGEHERLISDGVSCAGIGMNGKGIGDLSEAARL